jgi:hypothetical protein
MRVRERSAHIHVHRIALIGRALGNERLICDYLQLWITVVKDPL